MSSYEKHGFRNPGTPGDSMTWGLHNFDFIVMQMCENTKAHLPTYSELTLVSLLSFCGQHANIQRFNACCSHPRQASSDRQALIRTCILHQCLNCAGNFVVFPLTLDSSP